MHGLVRYFVFFVIRLRTREVEIAGITAEPHGMWIQQVGRNLTDALDGFLRDTPSRPSSTTIIENATIRGWATSSSSLTQRRRVERARCGAASGSAAR